jgi:Protein of unknown function (DUF2950)
VLLQRAVEAENTNQQPMRITFTGKQPAIEVELIMHDQIQKRNGTGRSGWWLKPAMALLATFVATAALAQEAGEKTFTTPPDASAALYQAAKAGDKSALENVLGASAKGIISSGDAVADQKNLDDFIRRYEQMNRWGKEVNGDQTLFLGAENWPFPIPLKKDASGQWYFDTKAGVEEVLYRRIGHNEYAAIRVCGVLADGEMDYHSGLHDGSTVHQYAQKLISDPGKHNGLYWKAVEGEPDSPIGPLIAYANGEGYKDKDAAFHGYFFRILASQGAGAHGGAKNYIVDGRMTGGFAFLAYPATYRNSGVMTFLVDGHGAIYEKDLGPNTADAVSAMTSFNADSTWRQVSAATEDEAQVVDVQ